MTERTLKLTVTERMLHFKQPAGTSRGVYTERRSWIISATDGKATGVGECAPLPSLSCDDMPRNIYNNVLRRWCDEVERTGQIPYEELRPYPSMLFGLETALLSLKSKVQSVERATAIREGITPCGSKLYILNSTLFDTPFSRGEEGIPINGLVWMGTHDEMLRRIEQKLEAGFRCIKLKIGAIDFDQELDLIKHIREHYGPREVELRVDANGAFDSLTPPPSTFNPQPSSLHPPLGSAASLVEEPSPLYKLELLSQYALHSIEQPIRARQWAQMAELCRESPLPIALDEELIGVNDTDTKRQMLRIIKPAYIVLKPSLHGGMSGCREWIDIAREEGIGSWITSALESNIGLNAIAQLCADVYGPNITMPQGLGTGQLFTDNIDMPIEIRGDRLWTCNNS